MASTVKISDTTFNYSINGNVVTFSGGDFFGKCEFIFEEYGSYSMQYSLPVNSDYPEKIIPKLKDYLYKLFYHIS